MVLADIPRESGAGSIWVWVEFPAGSEAEYSPPMPGYIESWSFPPVGATGIELPVIEVVGTARQEYEHDTVLFAELEHALRTALGYRPGHRVRELLEAARGIRAERHEAWLRQERQAGEPRVHSDSLRRRLPFLRVFIHRLRPDHRGPVATEAQIGEQSGL